jgi:hypothetical protein
MVTIIEVYSVKPAQSIAEPGTISLDFGKLGGWGLMQGSHFVVRDSPLGQHNPAKRTV